MNKARLVRDFGAQMLCSILAGCALYADRPADPASAARVSLGARDVVELPKSRSRLDDFTCGSGPLFCEDYVTKLRCGCSATWIESP